MQSELYAEAIAAANVLLRNGYGIQVRKGLNPLNERDFLTISSRLSRSMNTAGVAEDVAMRQAIRQLDVDWGNLSASSRTRHINAARRTVAGSAKNVLPAVTGVMEIEGPRVIKETRKAVKRRYKFDIVATTSSFDQRIGEHIVSSQGNFITSAIGVRADQFALQARGIVGIGLQQGLSREDIAARMEKDLLRSGLGRKKSYWQVVAGSFANRGRTFAQFSSYRDAGIEKYLFDSVLDEDTTDTCRYMHGRIFTTSSGISKFNEVENLTDPEEIKSLQPWARTRQVGERSEIQFKTGGENRTMARVLESAVGRRDEVGRFSGGLSSSQLSKSGIQMPPLHGHCRSTVVPDI